MLFMGVLIVLATMGLVYGSWQANVDINGAVTTGNVNVELVVIGAQENDAEKGKNFANCSAEAFDIVSDAPNDPKDDKVQLTINNGFPGYSCNLSINLVNRGSLPVVVSGTVKANAASEGAISVTPKTDDCETLQLNPGDIIYCDWDIGVLKGADQKAVYEFDINVTADLINKPAD